MENCDWKWQWNEYRDLTWEWSDYWAELRDQTKDNGHDFKDPLFRWIPEKMGKVACASEVFKRACGGTNSRRQHTQEKGSKQAHMNTHSLTRSHAHRHAQTFWKETHIVKTHTHPSSRLLWIRLFELAASLPINRAPLPPAWSGLEENMEWIPTLPTLLTLLSLQSSVISLSPVLTSPLTGHLVLRVNTAWEEVVPTPLPFNP